MSALECGLYLDNRVFILVSNQTNMILTNQNQDKKEIKHVKILSGRSKESKEQKKKKRASLLRNSLRIHKIHSLASY